jgi:hypothetical protein
MHDLSEELRALPRGTAADVECAQALRSEGGAVFSVRTELLIALYAAVATLIAGVGLLVKANLDHIDPVALLTGIFAAAVLCYAIVLYSRRTGSERSLGQDYVLLLGALLFSSAVAYAEVQFHVLGAGWSRHLSLLAVWHLVTAYLFRSRLLLAVALTAFAGWLGVEAQLGTLLNPRDPLLRAGPRGLLCALVFWMGSRFHVDEGVDSSNGFRDVYRQFAINFAFWGALALGADPATRWVGALTLLVLAAVVGRAGFVEKRESFLLYAVGYSTVGLVWLESLLLGSYLLTSWIGLFTVIGAVMLLLRLRSRLKESAN